MGSGVVRDSVEVLYFVVTDVSNPCSSGDSKDERVGRSLGVTVRYAILMVVIRMTNHVNSTHPATTGKATSCICVPEETEDDTSHAGRERSVLSRVVHARKDSAVDYPTHGV